MTWQSSYKFYIFKKYFNENYKNLMTIIKNLEVWMKQNGIIAILKETKNTIIIS